jgi:hypothetical protein
VIPSYATRVIPLMKRSTLAKDAAFKKAVADR